MKTTNKKNEKIEGTSAIAQRMANAETKFVEFAMESAGLTKTQAEKAMVVMKKAKVLKIDIHVGQFTFSHGAYADKDVLIRASQM